MSADFSNATRVLTDFMTNLSYENIPDSAKKSARRCLLEILSGAVAGYPTDYLRNLDDEMSTPATMKPLLSVVKKRIPLSRPLSLMLLLLLSRSLLVATASPTVCRSLHPFLLLLPVLNTKVQRVKNLFPPSLQEQKLMLG